MNCEEARPLLMDSLSSSGEPALDPAVDDHIQNCQSCRELWRDLSTAWSALDRLGVPPLSEEKASEMLARLREAQAVGQASAMGAGTRSERIWRRVLATAAVLVAALLGAVVSRTPVALSVFPLQTQGSTLDSTLLGPFEAGGGLYLFLLHRPEQLTQTNRGPRYQEWADTLESSNRLVRAGALSNVDNWMVTGQPPSMRTERLPAPGGEIEGFFLIAARDSTDVIDAVRLSPHMGFGGTIEVRRVIN